MDPELEQIDEDNLEENRSDETYYDKPNHNKRDGNTNSEKKANTDILSPISLLLEQVQHSWSAVKTLRNLSSSQKNGIYISDFIN